MADLLEKLLKAIPEASYDLISRMLPGGIVIAAAMSANVPILGLKIAGAPTVPEAVVFLAFSYAVGLAISSFIHVFHTLTWFIIYPILRFGKVNDSLLQSLKQPNQNAGDLKLNWNPFLAQSVLGRAHDIIKQRNIEERPVVVKLFAEVSLLYSLTIGFVVALFIIGKGIEYWTIPVAFFLAGMFRSVRTWYRHASILGALVMSQQQQRTPKAEKLPQTQ